MTRNSESDKAIVTAGQINELAYEDIILSTDYKTKEGKLAFKLVKTCKGPEFPEGNGLAWDRFLQNMSHRLNHHILIYRIDLTTVLWCQ